MSGLLLHTPYKHEALGLPNRVVMAPLTRCHADNPTQIPTEIHVSNGYLLHPFFTASANHRTDFTPRPRGYIDYPKWSVESATIELGTY